MAHRNRSFSQLETSIYGWDFPVRYVSHNQMVYVYLSGHIIMIHPEFFFGPFGMSAAFFHHDSRDSRDSRNSRARAQSMQSSVVYLPMVTYANPILTYANDPYDSYEIHMTHELCSAAFRNIQKFFEVPTASATQSHFHLSPVHLWAFSSPQHSRWSRALGNDRVR